jgi:hypothetical protein
MHVASTLRLPVPLLADQASLGHLGPEHDVLLGVFEEIDDVM